MWKSAEINENSRLFLRFFSFIFAGVNSRLFLRFFSFIFAGVN